MLLSNLCGQKQTGQVWNFLVEKLLSLGFWQSLIDECTFYLDYVIFILNDDLGPNDHKLSNDIKENKTSLDIEDQGHLTDCVGLTNTRGSNGYHEFTQQVLIGSIINDVNIGMHTLSLDILFETHQIAKYSPDPRKEHGEAIIYLMQYLKTTLYLGLKFHPIILRALNAFSTQISRKTGMETMHKLILVLLSHIIFYARCPIIWASVSLSITEAEYTFISMAFRDIIPVMELLDKLKHRYFQLLCTQPIVYCKVFEDNSGPLEPAHLPELCPRTKHINVCDHHIPDNAQLGLIKVVPISTDDQIADILTKPLSQNSFSNTGV
ncbi:LOW QUALITY PROTEIN: hypothetical protein ACHAW6_008390 [Cyclotella cf. meneghiniana]